MATDRAVLLDASGRPLRRPVVYLDHSTLVDAFDGKRGERANAAINAELTAIVEDVASRGTLCLSVVHAIELVQWPRRDDALAMAQWLDGLCPLWFQMEGAAEAELAHEVMRRLGMRSAPAPRLPIHHAMAAAFRDNLKGLSAEGTLDILRAPNLHGSTRAAYGKLDGKARDARAWMVSQARRMYDDRSSIPGETPPEHVHAVIERKWFVQLQLDARQAISTTALPVGEDYPSDPDISRAVREALDDLHAIPLTKLPHHLMGNFADGITRQDPTSRNFRDRHGSFLWDTRHASAAALVDVFTCDSYVDGILTNFRTSRGMQSQVSMRGRDRTALIAELRGQCA